MIQHNDAYTQKKEKQNPADIILLSLSYVYSGCHKVFFFPFFSKSSWIHSL